MCDERERLIGYLYDECADDERRRVEAHVETCDTCRVELAGLRATRQDLLAWDVPDHGSVWKPFAPVRVAPSWRDIPVWAMAAAASVMFLIGAAGGFATRALMPAAVAAAPAVASQAVAPSTVDSAAALQQIRDLIRSEVDQRAVPSASRGVQAVSVQPLGDDLMKRVRALVEASEQQQGLQWQSSVGRLLSDCSNLFKTNDRKIEELNIKLERILTEKAGR